ncbi:hypothetical protein HHI36_013504 [Cryptolaemus montrouzieri]|uniref:UBA domain-containing protein n=1 Tax=Cryptolaemus montrouzieri TaxID=559131 RepID=A0ABD2NIC0_9CUCU
MFEDYNDAYINYNLKKIIVNTLKPEIIKKLIIAIPELLKDKIAYSLIKDPFLFGTILKPCVLKNHIEKHPSLLLALDYILKKILKESDKNRIRPYVHLSDEDFSESDDIEIDYTDHVLGNTNVSYDPITITQLANAIQNANRNNLEMNEHEQEDIDMFQLPLFHDRVFENAMLNVLQNRNTIEQQQGPSNIGLTSQLRQMHELGLTDDLLNFRALGVAGGDMQEAVELILNGIID